MCSSGKDNPCKPSSSSSPGGSTSCPTCCCCCVANATIQNVRAIGATPQTVGTGYSLSVSNGHVFDFVIEMSFAAGAARTSDCTFEWWEKVNLPALPGVAPGSWNELRAMFPTNIAFNPWNNRTVPCPGGGSLTITITDLRALGLHPGKHSSAPSSLSWSPSPVRDAAVPKVALPQLRSKY